MNTVVFGDFETTGLPLWKEPSGGDNQPHIVQAAAILVDADTRNIIQTIDLIVKPNGWVIPDETVEIHGITNEFAHDVGVSENNVISLMVELCDKRKRVFYNSTFDNRIARIATKRYLSEETQSSWKEGEYECAMIASKKAMGVKSVKLIDAYKHFTGKELEGAHSAMSDTKACMEVYFAIQDLDDPIADVKF